MTNEEAVNRILGLLGQYKRPKTIEWLIGFIEKDLKKRDKEYAQWGEYYKKNRAKIDTYHKEYRKQHPEYEERRRERARIKKNLD